jgi:hypothetical protein
MNFWFFFILTFLWFLVFPIVRRPLRTTFAKKDWDYTLDI